MAITECRFDAAAPFHLTVVFRLPLLVKNLGKKIDFKRQSLPSALRKTLSGRGREFSPAEAVLLGAPDTHLSIRVRVAQPELLQRCARSREAPHGQGCKTNVGEFPPAA